jgi:hypothetical protein
MSMIPATLMRLVVTGRAAIYWLLAACAMAAALGSSPAAAAEHNSCTASHLETATRPVCQKWNGPTCVYNGPDVQEYKVRVCDAYTCDAGYLPAQGLTPSSGCYTPARVAEMAAAKAESQRKYSAADLRDLEAGCRRNGATCHDIATAYRFGSHGVTPNIAKFLPLGELGCRAGDFALCEPVADEYTTNRGPHTNLAKAFGVLNSSCQHSHTQNTWAYCAKLGVLYADGKGGAPQDLDKARKYLRTALNLHNGTDSTVFAGDYIDEAKIRGLLEKLRRHELYLRQSRASGVERANPMRSNDSQAGPESRFPNGVFRLENGDFPDLQKTG